MSKIPPKLIGVVPVTIDNTAGEKVIMGSAKLFLDGEHVMADITLPSPSWSVLEALGLNEMIDGFVIDSLHATPKKETN